MSESFESDPSQDANAGGAAGEDEGLDALPVLMGRPRIVPTEQRVAASLADQRRATSMIPAVQAAAVAAGGFVAGAAVVGLVHRRHRRSQALPRGRRAARDLSKGTGRPGAKALELVQIVGSRSLLVDVHLLGSSEDR